MEKGFIWTVLGILSFFSSASCFYPEYYVEDLCKVGNETIIYETSQMGAAGTLKATSLPPYHANKNCTIILKPPADKGIVLSVRKIDMRERNYLCQDYIKIFHSDIFTSPTVLCRFKHDLKEKISFYTEGPMTLVYHVGPSDYPHFTYEEGFMLTFTVAATDIQDCINDDMYMCGNGRYIPKDMTCDGRNNCGDQTDESPSLCDSTYIPYVHLTDMMYIAIFALLLLSILSMCVFVVSRHRRRRSLDSDSDSEEPTTRLTPYHAVHPGGFGICQNPAGPAYENKIVGFSNPCYPSGVPQPPPPYYSQ